MDSLYICIYIPYKECACFARTLLSRSLHACCYDLEMVVQWISVLLPDWKRVVNAAGALSNDLISSAK